MAESSDSLFPSSNDESVISGVCTPASLAISKRSDLMVKGEVTQEGYDGSDVHRGIVEEHPEVTHQANQPGNGRTIPSVGIDIGGTLVKVAYFEHHDHPIVPNSHNCTHDHDTASALRNFIKSVHQYGTTGERDARLEIKDLQIGTLKGDLHFIRFPTSRMTAFFKLVEGLKAHEVLKKELYATGGGAYKFEADFQQVLGLRLVKCDELECLMQGIHFIDANVIGECYYLKFPQGNNVPEKISYDFQSACPYPFIVVNIGSGVSILAVRSSTQFERISGTAVGGGTFVGLSCLLTGCHTFEEAIALAAEGDHEKVDKLVRDIYGGDYARFGLPGNVVASSFGSMVLPENRANVKKEDLARAALMMITNNIGSIARMCAVNQGIDRVVFAGNFLRKNVISMEFLAKAMDFWSKGTMKALFLEHEGYFGAVGALLESLNDTH